MKTGQARRVKAEQMPQAIPAQEDTAHTENSAATVSVRNTRPKMDLHKDARACLEAANNKAVIKCANKYR